MAFLFVFLIFSLGYSPVLLDWVWSGAGSVGVTTLPTYTVTTGVGCGDCDVTVVVIGDVATVDAVVFVALALMVVNLAVDADVDSFVVGVTAVRVVFSVGRVRASVGMKESVRNGV